MSTLLDLLKNRHSYAKRFTKDFQEEVKRNLKDYKAEDEWLRSFTDEDQMLLQVSKRYEIIIPMIFTTHEGMLASMFDRVPDLLIGQKGQLDATKVKKIVAAYEYLKDKLSLDQFMNTAAWWYLLTGFVSVHGGYEQRGSKEVQAINEQTGEPEVNELGEPLMVPVYDYDDPTISVDDPMFTFFAPGSQYSIDAEQIPYYTRYKLMTTDDIQKIYGVEVEPDATMKVDDDNKNSNDAESDDLKRAKVYFYYGHIPTSYKDDEALAEVEYDQDGWYYGVFTSEKILHIERMPGDMKTCRLLKWYGVPTEFFGFGIAKLLRPFQKEKSLRRTQQARYADVAAYPKLAVSAETDIDESAASDPRELPVILFNGERPEYLTPPDLSNVLLISEDKADRDAQQASGMLDISQGSQQSTTVKTATGQSIFAEAAERRIRYAKAHFMDFYKEVVIMLLKIAQDKWTTSKVVSLTDDYGNQESVEVSAQDLSDIDFDTDISINPDSLTINKDVLRAQAIELYDRVKDDPLINRRVVFMDMMQSGFNKKDPERFLKELEVQPGMKLVNPQTGQAYTVSETGELVTDQEQQELATPQGAQNVPDDQAGVMGASQMV